eukprot:GFKZ01009929.1.p1 GENE.GFKZ01009929.1~~GFKZ01009929.1.p1  ORF type:complete len:188 (+),score=21.91 GFKZ01009929.1:395-958(+)
MSKASKLLPHCGVGKNNRNPTYANKMRCTVGLYNGDIKASHFYDVFRNPNYIINKPFPHPKKFEWLRITTSELNPVPASPPENDQSIPPNAWNAAELNDISREVQPFEQNEGRNNQRTPEDTSDRRKRPIGVKAANNSKIVKLDAEKEDGTINSAIDSWTKWFVDASSASIEAANVRAHMDCEQAQR